MAKDLDMILISNTKVANGTHLSHAAEDISDAMEGRGNEILFIPYARPDGMSYEKYHGIMSEILTPMGYNLKLISKENPEEDIKNAKALFVGGGNTWKLLKELKDRKLIPYIKQAVTEDGTLYIGSSAGSNVAGQTIGNTNDMPAADPEGFEAMGLVPFNINPHYVDPPVVSKNEMEQIRAINADAAKYLEHQGETRDARLKEYHALGNKEKVVAMREGALLKVHNNKVMLKGTTGAKIYLPGGEPQHEYESGANLSQILMN